MRVEPILFKQLSVFFLERDLLMDCMLLLDVPSEPVKVAERHAERVESGSPTGEVGIFRGFLVYRSRGAFHLVHDLAEIPGIRNLDKYMHVVEKGIGGMYAATFPVKIRVIRSSINPFPVVGIVILRPLVTKMRWYRCRILPITSNKMRRGLS